MKFRWKLLILLAVMSILPVIAQRTYGIHHVRNMADALLRHLEQSKTEEAFNRLELVAGQFSRSIARSREQVEMALFIQSLEARHLLENDPEMARRRFPPEQKQVYDSIFPTFSEDSAGYHSGTHPFGMVYGRSQTASPIRPADLLRLANHFHSISRHIGALSIRHLTMVGENMLAWPLEPKHPDIIDPWHQKWVDTAVSDRHTMWSAPYLDPVSGLPVMAVAAPLDWEDVQKGMTAIIVSLEALAEPESILSALPDGSGLKIVTTAPRAGRDLEDVYIMMSFTKRPGSSIFGEVVQTETRNHSGDKIDLQEVFQHIIHRKSGVYTRIHNPSDELWAYGLLPHQGTGFVLTASRSRMFNTSLDRLRSDIVDRVANVGKMTVGSLILLIGLVLVTGLWFSGRVTRALDALAEATRRLAAGDFDSRAGIQSQDEFGDIGRAFDRVGPQLKLHYQMLRSAEVAMEIQQRLLPAAPPSVQDWDIDAMTLYCEVTGGDYYDYLCTGADQKLCLAVGDVTGHGMPSAILMASVRGMLRLRAASAGRLEDIITDVNRCFSRDMGDDAQFMTLFLARIDRVRQVIEWVRAGHEPGVLYDAGTNKVIDLKGEGMALGVFEDCLYGQSSSPFSEQQILCLFSDGITETRNMDGELFGRNRLVEAIRQYADLDARNLVLSILDAVAEFRGEGEQEDDLTVMIVKHRMPGIGREK